MGRKLTAVAFVLLTLLPLARVAATWHVFSRTIDEPAHVGAGREWLEKGTYQRDVEHPPLARVLEAIAGARVEAIELKSDALRPGLELKSPRHQPETLPISRA